MRAVGAGAAMIDKMVLRWTILVLLLGSTASAQTADVLFGGWDWRPREAGSRPAGLAGAYVAVADSVRTITTNPAGLALVPEIEVSAGTSERWIGIAYRIEPKRRKPQPPTTAGAPAAPSRPTEASAPLPCPERRVARPWVVAAFGEPSVDQAGEVDVVRGPGMLEKGRLASTTDQVGVALAKGVLPWLDVGATVAWRALRVEGRSTVADADDRELSFVTVDGAANKARLVAGALLSFGPSWSPTAFRLGVSYHRDLAQWRVDRTAVDRASGVVTSGPTPAVFAEPDVLSLGAAWRVSDLWLVSAQVDEVRYDRVRQAYAANVPGGPPLRLENHLEPRAAVELTMPSPIGGYMKLRAGVRREVGGRFADDGSSAVLRQAFLPTPAVVRASAGASLLAEFYDKAARFDVDLSQVVLQRQSTLRAAGTRRFSFGLTVRL